MDDRNRGMLVN